jgi:hypothetical protein
MMDKDALREELVRTLRQLSAHGRDYRQKGDER